MNECDLTRRERIADEAELLGAVRRGDRAAFRAVYELFGGEVLAVCERILHNRADAEDAMADIFWELWQRRDRYDASRGAARSYLMTLARSRAIDRLRSQASRPDSRPSAGEALAEQPQAASAATTPEGAAAGSELRSRIVEAFGELSERQREAMELAYFEGLSHQQIAVRLDAPLGTVKTHIRKALAKLRFTLQAVQAEEFS